MMAVSNVGWECPVCHRGLPPHAQECQHGGLSATGLKTNVPWVETPPSVGMWKCGGCGQWHMPGHVCVFLAQTQAKPSYPK